MHYRVASCDVCVWYNATGAVFPLDGSRLFLLDFDLDLGLLDVAGGRAHLARAVSHVAILVGAQPKEMGKELDRAPEALLGTFGVSIEIGVLSVVAATRVVLDCLQLTVCLGLDMLVEDIVLG